MANLKKRLRTNVDGPFFVDSTCINCDTCRQLAPETFAEEGEYSSVFKQPESEEHRFKSYQALLACPVGSIGTTNAEKRLMESARSSFPICLDGPVYYTGFNSEKSFGANSYFIRHPEGNWLVDSPRYLAPLVKWFREMGGIRYIFLTHEDDVADAARYAREFQATRIIHRADAAAMPEAEWIIDVRTVVEAGLDFCLIPSPGHTPGSMVLLHRDRYLFTGDHLYWNREAQGFRMPRVYLWSEAEIRQSTEALLDYPFEWVLPGHGERIMLPATRMKQELRRVLDERGPVV